MRLCSRPGALYAWALLAFLCHCATAVERHYYIAAVNINWDYTSGQQRTGQSYKKVVYREYNEGFTQPKAHPPSSGLLGPTLRGQEGDTIIVTFKNMADHPCSLHPHGIAYGKQSEGSLYFDNTSRQEKDDDTIHPGEQHTYHWEVTSEVTPTAADPPCITYTYLSHYDIVRDYNTGLIGTMLICKKGIQINFHQEVVLLFGMFDESKSWYSTDDSPRPQNIKYSINGYTNGSIPDLDICAHSKTSWHLLGMSSEPELFSVHFNGQVFLHDGHKASTIGIISGTSTSASMTGVYPGRWLISSLVNRHMEAALHGYLNIRMCDEFQAPKRRLTIQQKEESQEWTYYIAAEELTWDYAPNMPENMDGDFRSKYLKQGPQRIGKKYKKAVFAQYKDGTFKERVEDKQRKKELGILGPVIRAQLRDVITIVFKNKASRPYSIYPHGLTIDKAAEGARETYTYTWSVSEEDVPTDSDPRCLTRMYHSAVDSARDIASGLIGPLLICKSQSLNKKNIQLKSDKEQHAMFTVFDENKSWYHDENIRTYCSDPKKVKKDDPMFYQSNVMHTINGYVYESGQDLGFCHGEIVTWHVMSVGGQDYIQTVTFYGHTFELKSREEDILTLFPMTGETITMSMVNIASLTSHDSTKGMRVKFKDLECFRDYVMEYDYEVEKYTVLKPPLVSEIKQDDPKPVKTTAVFDEYSDNIAETLGIRSFSKVDDEVELIDFSFLEHDDALLPTVEEDIPNATLEHLNGQSLSKEEEDLTNNETDHTVFNCSNVKREVRSASSDPTREIPTVETNSTKIDKSDSSSEGDEPFHSSMAETNITNAINATVSIDASFGSSDAPMSERTISLQNSSASLNSSELITPLSNQTTINETGFPIELQSKNSSDSNRDDSGNIFIYNVPRGDSITNNSEPQTGENFVLLEPSNSIEISPDFKGSAEHDFSFMDSVEVTENTKQVQESNSTKNNQSNGTFSDSGNIFNLDSSSLLSNKELDSSESLNGTLADSSSANMSDFSDKKVPFLNGTFSDVLNSTLTNFSNAALSVNGTLSNSSLGSELRENRTSSTNDSMQSRTTFSMKTSELFYSENALENVSFSLGLFDASSLRNASEKESEEEEEEEEKEVVIYLKNNRSEAIVTSHLNTNEVNWSYEGKHELVHLETPEHMKKYLREKSAENSIKPKNEKKRKVVHQRIKPRRGHGMKTKKRKEYKPQQRSSFSPRGFGPPVVTPGGSKPVSSEDELMGKSIVIGVPRRDFNDYELYVPKEDQDEDFHDLLSQPEDYEYVEYKDPYAKAAEVQAFDSSSQHFLKMAGDKNTRTYFISAEEEDWDFAGYGQRRLDKPSQNERPTAFKKVVFRKYLDSSFTILDIRGEMDEHLGILGPVIKAEVDQTVMVFFRNRASRPYSLHANGVKYLKQMEGLSYDDQSPYWYKQDDAVQPNGTFTYMWSIDPKSGPQNNESDCRTWTYYSAVNPERDINSGLIGPLLVCRKGTLDKKPIDRREFVLLFMTFDENKSWYYEENRRRIESKNRRTVMNPNFHDNLKFDGLRMYTNQLAKWHLINMGSPKDLHSIHFHGQTFINKELKDHRQGVYPLLPGAFATLEMLPSKPGLWQLESEVGHSQQRGMQTLFLVLDKVCDRPLGLISGTVQDEQITASDNRGQWYPHLARLHNTGKFNAWSTSLPGQYIQVDFHRPVVISKVATQGAKQFLKRNFVLNYTISYSTDKKKWIFYKGDRNTEAYETKENIFFPPLIGRYVRLHPLHSYNYPTVRLEYFGCELDGCSVPLGMENGVIEDSQITASSVASSWYSGEWHPWYARLNKQGTTNAWQAKNNDIQPWIQVELKEIKKITGIVTQGAKALRNEMFVTEYILEYSNDGKRWTKYTDDDDYEQKMFQGNSDNNGQIKNYIYPPIFSRFIRIIPKQWQKSVTMRIELLGCDSE
ncbi:hypothetical protein DNTS_033554 [Danionella cerebrum]|uniref:ferroxidase n=1 Tax=Danionella cerebrum TaxID=2873325 RepID=A0A553N1L8_9TELE|nr:hypothetical protein DNTS_033554 [Danionella translucida]TRY59322.1 hypothetical protein DNTS_033554 [Danionella translucida]TRY59323.1 hypothetical protein DNTS_033554 [Danionella translucida]TRY59324.1 hypothetical protein DNTS_033554 [Danionella translucida]